jgi:L-lysine 2,3-aminomutase
MEGIQHKYRETVLFFPTEGQYCHSFCTYCFRWCVTLSGPNCHDMYLSITQIRAQFTSVGSTQQFQSKDAEQLVSYIRNHRNINDILFTGGDPMVMRAHQLARYIDAIIADPGCGHLTTIRIGSKSLAWVFSASIPACVLKFFDKVFGPIVMLLILMQKASSVSSGELSIAGAISR